MDDRDDFTWMGILFLVLRLLGVALAIIIPIYVVYLAIKWLFD